jgi:hypothetical protein
MGPSRTIRLEGELNSSMTTGLCGFAASMTEVSGQSVSVLHVIVDLMDGQRMPPSRRIPLQSVRGADEETTDLLRLVFYLVEVERQAEVFNLSFADAMKYGLETGASTETWRHLQSAMFAAIVVNRMVSREQRPHPWPGKHGEGARKLAADAAKWRASKLRALLGLSDSDGDAPIFSVRKIRDSLEHVDERLDMALHSGVFSLSDWYVSNGWLLVSVEQSAVVSPKAGLRAFCPEAGLVFFDRDTLDMFKLDRDMLGLRHNAREAQQELIDQLRGRQQFGGDAQVVQVAPSLWDRRKPWRADRAEIERSFAPPPRRLDGYVRLWAELGNSGAQSHG